LKGELNSGQLEVQQLRDGISVNLAQDIRVGSAQLEKTGRELLLKVLISPRPVPDRHRPYG
jgi:hypothetical protein